MRTLLLLLSLVFLACRSLEPFRVPAPLGQDLFAPVPDDNPLTRERIALGARLFVDPLLSVDRSVSCSSCHRPANAFSDSIPFSRGAHGRTGKRNAPSILNVVYRSSFFWDGRASSLEEQVLQPIQDSLEMDLPLAELESRVRESASYSRAFRRAFGEDVSAQNIARALASYLRTLRSGNAPIDRFKNGDTTALSPLARRGADLFVGKAHCAACHLGPNLSDGDFHSTGVAWRGDTLRDPGRFAVTGRAEDRGLFKTPSLRNVAVTAPYMHDGSMRTLEEIIEFYDGGGRRNPNLDPVIRPLRLTPEEKRALAEFLDGLTGSAVRVPEDARGNANSPVHHTLFREFVLLPHAPHRQEHE
jgi:cytochrome c peroxidase